MIADLDALPDISDETGYRPLFKPDSLMGWTAIPRVYGDLYPGGPPMSEVFAQRGVTPVEDPEAHLPRWTLSDGVLTGGQSEPGSGYGGYLISDADFGDFDFAVEVRPDWPADTGVMLRRRRDDWAGFQVLVDHRPSGSIGGFFGNGLASFSAVPFSIDARTDETGRPLGLRADAPETSLEPVTPDKIARLSLAGSVEDFLDAWRWKGWNELRVRCVGGDLPVITTWVNGNLTAQLDTATLDSPLYDATAVARHLGARGHIAFEVHDNDAALGTSRWAPGAVCRWRGMRIREY
ncbi:DUF1080 domain-containing protein [Microbacterium aoyamense]|uniref:DUF1080 domain-containing protein n=1 Tax=Microbacterium aoyamense TaxID=344166 RepID=A0ABP5ANC8_9MICO|nr:DUF1080 domain-containing protein [Microbacterium aoyamense]